MQTILLVVASCIQFGASSLASSADFQELHGGIHAEATNILEEFDSTSLMQTIVMPTHVDQTKKIASLPAGVVDITELAETSKKMLSQRKKGSCLAKATDKLFRGVHYTYDEFSSLTANTIMILLMLASLFILFLGAKIAIASLFIIVASAAFYLTFEVLASTTDNCTLPLVGAVVVGAICGLLALCMFKPAFIIVGAVFGVMIACLIWTIVGVVAGDMYVNNLRILFWISVILTGLIGGYFGYHHAENALALVTSLLGAYGFGVGLRGFLEVFSAYHMSNMAWLMTMAIAFVLGFAVQMSFVRSK